MIPPSLDGRRFRPVAVTDGGEVDRATEFHYHERGGEIWAEFAGGSISRGFLVGTRRGDIAIFRYVQLNTNGRTASGRCTSTISVMPGGRLRLDETWAWESKDGEGTSALEEV